MQRQAETGIQTTHTTHIVGRLLNVLDYALGAIRRKFARNLLVFLVFSSVVFLFASFQLMTSALTELGQKILVTAPDITVQQMTAGRQALIEDEQAEQIRKIYGVRGVSPRVWGYYFDEKNGANYTVWGLDSASWAGGTGLPAPDSGKWPEKWGGKVVLGARVHENLELGTRKMFSLFQPDLSLISFEAAGIFGDEYDILTSDTIFMGNEDVRSLFTIDEGLSTELLVDVANRREIDTIAMKISERLPGVRVVTRNQILKTYQAVFSWRSGFGFVCLLSALVSFGIFAWDKATGLSAEEIREVGILKIIGWQSNDIILLRFFESASLAAISFLVGYLGAWLHILVFNGMMFRPVLLGWSVLRPEFRMVPSFTLNDLLMLLAIVIVPYFCATIIPAWRAATVPADSVI